MTSSFAPEQRALADACWNFVGITDDLVSDGDWIRRSLFGTDCLIQRFGDDLRAFHNVCSHRGFPLRIERAGRGPLRCGFHGWGYSSDGVPNTIPRNAELFGLSREQREALALPPVRVETLGRFVFATLSRHVAPLADYLGPYARVYTSASTALGPLLGRESCLLTANWKRHAEISLDDYHLSQVHGSTFGAVGELGLHQVVYRRDRLHSCYLKRRDPDWSFDGFWRDIEAGVIDRTGYKIFNAFPGIVIALTRDVCFASGTYALGADRCQVDTYMFTWGDAPATPAGAAEIVAYFTTVFREDREACERWERGEPTRAVIGRLEQRVEWFREAYAEVMRGRAGSPSGHA